MKKTYIIPQTEVMQLAQVEMIATSITSAKIGETDVEIGTGDPNGLEVDVKGNMFEENPWEE